MERRKATLLVLGLCLLGVGVVAAAHIGGVIPVDNGLTIGSDSGMNVTVTGSTNMLFEDAAWPTSNQVYIITEAGNASFTASGPALATVHKDEIEGTWTNLTAIDASANTITVDPDDKDSFVVGKELDSVSVKDSFAIDDGNVDFAYSASANGRLTIQNLQANTQVAAIDKDTGNILDSDTTDGNGQITFDALDSGTHDVTIQTFTPAAPTLSDESPTGQISTPPDELSIQVNDSDFPRTDSVTVTVDLDGSQIHSETITSNGTVTASVPASGKTGGSHSWSVEATDDYGETTTDSFSYEVPSQIQIRDESPAHDLIKGTQTNPIRVEATFYEDVEDSPTIINRATTDGNVSLDGLPVSSDFSVSIEAPGYHNRTVRVENIFEQSDVFLINKNQATIENRFSLSDRTGKFPNDETSIIVEAAVNETLYTGSGGFSWMAVAGDDLGADEAFTTDLKEEKRYRIVVRNDDGDTRVLGAYTAETAGTIEMTIGRVELSPSQGEFVAYNASYQNTTSGPEVIAGYNDTSQNTTRLHLHIYERNNESNKLVSNTSFSGPFGEFKQVQPVPADENDTTWVVEITAEIEDGETQRYSRLVGPRVSTLTDMPNYLVSILFVGTIWMVAGLFSRLNGGIGAIVVAGLGGIFFFMGVVPAYLGGGVVALSLLAAAMLVLRERGAGGL